MTKEDQPQFVPVPVPAQYVSHVYAYLAELTGTAASPGPAAPSKSWSGDDPLPVVEWTVDDFRRLMIEPLSSSQVFTRVLDLLANEPGKGVGYTELARRLGMERANLQGNFSAFTRFVRRQYARRNWPITVAEEPGSEPGYERELFYTMNATAADRWLKARAQEA
ncbi:helix-turn-helix transcriptional regulator [Actinomadura algeriensis]|uniref:Uncharacterized protein n=1 Tax=Actinomadura algeriensis TaxID=1679523 RepID=A0ABR9JN36_9ACTN|nr:helix-turn-helix transcriptional regulator [Actinomadura algeriensis]MBE1531984.1 hypothetical protein [Actinomadura algeriensis]